jgi:hypothetical protein
VELVERNGATIDAIKVLVLDHVLGGDAEGWIVDERLLKQIHAGRVDVLDGCGEIVLIPAGEGGLVVGQGGDTGPDLFGGRAENAEHSEELVDFGVSLEERLAGGHFGEDAAD